MINNNVGFIFHLFRDTPYRYWPLKSSKVNDFRVIWKTICDFLLVISNNLGSILRRLAMTVARQ